MGQAKRRGTFEQRLALALEKKANKAISQPSFLKAGTGTGKYPTLSPATVLVTLASAAVFNKISR